MNHSMLQLLQQLLMLSKMLQKKIKSRMAHLNKQEKRDKSFDGTKSFLELLDSEDFDSDDCLPEIVRTESYFNENESTIDASPLCSQIPPNSHYVRSKGKTCNTFNTQANNRDNGIINVEMIRKRALQDITNSPEVVCLGSNNCSDRAKNLCIKSEHIYNKTNQFDCNFKVSGSGMNKSGSSSSGGKLPPHGPRRPLMPSRHASDPFVPVRRRFPVSEEENKHYIAICCLACSRWQKLQAVDIDNVRMTFSLFGNSLKSGGDVSNYVMFAFCRLMFHNNHPSKSKKNYFFSSIGDKLLNELAFDEMAKIKKCFDGAATARKLHLCDMLFFPINHLDHWFLFIVNLKDRMLAFLDSLHHKSDPYFEGIIPMLINNFQIVWDKFECSAIDFNSFRVFFPPVPRQEFSCDSGIFVMKCIELWSPRVVLLNLLSKDDINNIRAQYMNKIFFHTSNAMLQTESEDLVVNWFQNLEHLFIRGNRVRST
uniref:Ubiquitin-like protease family profile domain-containing protein n=1 Tax=Oryza meridionalis TaxID=40149 RepID=A0A0E0EVF2_9ORYZ